MMLAFGGRGISVQVPFPWSTLNFSGIATHHSGSRSAVRTEDGVVVGADVGEDSVATFAYRGFGTWMPSHPGVTMWCCGQAGGGGVDLGVGDAVGMVTTVSSGDTGAVAAGDVLADRTSGE